MKDRRDEKIEVVTRLLEVARLMRRRGTPELAAVVLPYETMLEHDLREREAELAQLPGMEHRKEVAA